MADGQKTELVTLAGPEFISDKDPLVIAFGQWDTAELPKDVTVELFEIDGKHDDKFTSSEDTVARFFGRLEPGPEDTAKFVPTKDAEITSPTRSPERIFVRFAGQPVADAVVAGIPFSSTVRLGQERKQNESRANNKEHIANEGSFYELKVRVRGEGKPNKKGKTKTVDLAVSGRTCVRQRAACLLAVEPLSQNNSGTMSSPAGKSIIDFYHPGEHGKHRRDWGGVVLRVLGSKSFRLWGSGCSYAVVTMVLRYLRVDAKPSKDPLPGAATEVPPSDPTHGKTVSLFDQAIDVEVLKAKHADSKPRFIKDVEYKFLTDLPSKRKDAEREAFVKHFVAKAKAHAKATGEQVNFDRLRNKLKKHFNSNTEGTGAAIASSTPVESNLDPSVLYKADQDITERDYIPLFCWKLNVVDGRKDDYRLDHWAQFEKRLVLEGAGDYRKLGHGEHEQWVPKVEKRPLRDNGGKKIPLYLHVKPGFHGKTTKGDTAIIIPISQALENAFGFTTEVRSVGEFTDEEPGDEALHPWQRWVVRNLDQGLPMIGIFAGGQYSARRKPAHYCVIVGYRYRVDPKDPKKRKIRFILNDPAGGGTFQYEAHDEEEINPPGKSLTERLRGKDDNIGMGRERRGLNVIMERRKLLSLREITLLKPKGGTWDPSRHARFVFWPGEVAS